MRNGNTVKRLLNHLITFIININQTGGFSMADGYRYNIIYIPAEFLAVYLNLGNKFKIENIMYNHLSPNGPMDNTYLSC